MCEMKIARFSAWVFDYYSKLIEEYEKSAIMKTLE
jgi:hypothetical protein